MPKVTNRICPGPPQRIRVVDEPTRMVTKRTVAERKEERDRHVQSVNFLLNRVEFTIDNISKEIRAAGILIDGIRNPKNDQIPARIKRRLELLSKKNGRNTFDLNFLQL